MRATKTCRQAWLDHCAEDPETRAYQSPGQCGTPDNAAPGAQDWQTATYRYFGISSDNIHEWFMGLSMHERALIKPSSIPRWLREVYFPGS